MCICGPLAQDRFLCSLRKCSTKLKSQIPQASWLALPEQETAARRSIRDSSEVILRNLCGVREANYADEISFNFSDNRGLQPIRRTALGIVNRLRDVLPQIAQHFRRLG